MCFCVLNVLNFIMLQINSVVFAVLLIFVFIVKSQVLLSL